MRLQPQKGAKNYKYENKKDNTSTCTSTGAAGVQRLNYDGSSDEHQTER